MKQEARLPWHGLAEYKRQPDWCHYLCGLCRYHYVWQDYEYGPEAECQHPLERVHMDEAELAMEGGDCWGFRPKYRWGDSRRRDWPSKEEALRLGEQWAQGNQET